MGNAKAEMEASTKTPIINIMINRDSNIGTPKFSPPQFIADPQKATAFCQPVESPNCMLSSYVRLDNAPNATSLITIFSSAGDDCVDIWTLNAIIQDDYLNYMYTTVNTTADDNFHGIMGLGEQTRSELFLDDGVYSLWTRDIADPVATGDLPAANFQGAHPFYMTPTPDGTWLGVYTNLAHASDWWIQNDKLNGFVDITTIATGGILDISLMFGSNPNEVTQRYHAIVGNPVLTPMWALGWNQCKFGDRSTEDYETAVKGYEDNNLPLDTLWMNVDYMEEYRNFEVDTVTFKGLPTFIEGLHNKSMKVVATIIGAIAQRENGDYDAYDTGKVSNVFINTYEGEDDYFTGNALPLDSVYPDWFRNNTTDWWKQMM